MVGTKHHSGRGTTAALVWLAFGFVGSACVAKPEFRCQSDAACVSADGSKGVCQANGECVFHATPAAQGGASGSAGDPVSDAGSASSDEEPGSAGSGGKDGSAGEPGTADDGDAGAAGAVSTSCSDDANHCYSCKPTTSEQFLNACTASACVPFDDHARITKLTASGDLPPLPTSGQ